MRLTDVCVRWVTHEAGAHLGGEFPERRLEIIQASSNREATLEGARKTLVAASLALRCAELGCLSADLARKVADLCDATLQQIGESRTDPAESRRRGDAVFVE